MEYFLIENGQQAGPFTIAQLAEKHITSETLVWAEGMADWTPAWKVAELKYILQGNGQQTGPQVPPIPASMQPAQGENASTEENADGQPGENTEATPTEEQPKKGKKKVWKIVLGVVVAILLILAFTNPGKDAHKEAVQNEIDKVIDKATNTGEDDYVLVQGFRAFAKMMSSTVMDAFFDEMFEYHNYIIFSKGTVTLNDKSHNVSFGILGKVYTINGDDVIKAIEKTNMLNLGTQDDKSVDQDSDDNSDSQYNADDDNDNDNSDADESVDKKLENKANEAIDKLSDKVSKKVEDKINQKLDELSDSSTVEKIVDKILSLF